MSEELKRRVALALVIVLLALVGWRFAKGWLGSTVAGQALGIQRSDKVNVESLLALDVAELRSADLMAAPGELTPGRDPWRFGPAAPKPISKPPPEPIAVAADPEPELKPAKEKPAKPKPPPIGDLECLGTFGPSWRKIAVFVDGETVVNALVGDVVKQHFLVHEIGLESVALTFVGFPDEPPARLAIGG